MIGLCQIKVKSPGPENRAVDIQVNGGEPSASYETMETNKLSATNNLEGFNSSDPVELVEAVNDYAPYPCEVDTDENGVVEILLLDQESATREYTIDLMLVCEKVEEVCSII